MNNIVITALEPQKNHPNRRSVYGNGMFLFGMDEESCVKTGIRIGKEYTSGELERIRSEAEYADAKQYAFRLLARRGYSVFMLQKKIIEKGYSPEFAERCTDFFCEMGYLNDEEYARAFLQNAVCIRKKGKRLALYELSLKGISPEIGERIWQEQDFPDDVLTEVIRKRLSDPSDPKCVRRTFDYCIRRGYDYGDVSRAIKEYLETVLDDPDEEIGKSR